MAHDSCTCPVAYPGHNCGTGSIVWAGVAVVHRRKQTMRY
jgi:hypothetical protein